MGTIQIDGSTPKLTIGNATAEDATILFDGNAQDFHIGLDDTADDLVIGVGSTLGTTTALAIDENANTTFSGTVTVGVDDTGKDVKLFGATSGSFLLWDESADSLLLTDSTPIKIGDAQDLTLYHDGSNSYITNAVGALKIATETSGIALTIGHTTSEVTIGDNLTTTGTLTVGSTVISTNGITMSEQWRLTTGFTGDATPIASNWEQADTDGAADLGSSLTESSGVFTFPSTGMWLIMATFRTNYNGSNRSAYFTIDTTTDGSNWSAAASASQGFAQSESAETYGTGACNFLFDVTSTSTHKFRIGMVVNNDSTTTSGDSPSQDTVFTVIRLGDT